MMRRLHAFVTERQRRRRVRFLVSAQDLTVILESLEQSNAPISLARRVAARVHRLPEGVLDRALLLSRNDALAILRALHAMYRTCSSEQGMYETVARFWEDDEVRPAIRQAKRRANYLRCLHGLLSDQYLRQFPRQPVPSAGVR